MKQFFLLFLVVCLWLLTACGALDQIRRSCMTDISKTQNGNFIFCAVCDSLTFDKILKNDTTNRQRRDPASGATGRGYRN